MGLSVRRGMGDMEEDTGRQYVHYMYFVVLALSSVSSAQGNSPLSPESGWLISHSLYPPPAPLRMQ